MVRRGPPTIDASNTCDSLRETRGISKTIRASEVAAHEDSHVALMVFPAPYLSKAKERKRALPNESCVGVVLL